MFVQSDIQFVDNDVTRTDNNNSELDLMESQESDKVDTRWKGEGERECHFVHKTPLPMIPISARRNAVP